ncbi:hypothetical protein PR048_027621 [Dryococelus australis]|uniref:Carboxylesterase type B domain-containing protein n=1 Tax=Dryococelus australis TaxID=614101 RepID=A0ABQ9GH01_9NEOP|nr:hypothetical protein PR048_027621 [Dryococelus australis]
MAVGSQLTWTVVGHLLLVVADRVSAVEQAAPIVRVRQGLVRGNTMTSLSGRTFLAYRGIPYARPPVGQLRFAVSDALQGQPPGGWRQVEWRDMGGS